MPSSEPSFTPTNDPSIYLLRRRMDRQRDADRVWLVVGCLLVVLATAASADAFAWSQGAVLQDLKRITFTTLAVGLLLCTAGLVCVARLFANSGEGALFRELVSSKQPAAALEGVRQDHARRIVDVIVYGSCWAGAALGALVSWPKGDKSDILYPIVFLLSGAGGLVVGIWLRRARWKANAPPS